MTQDDGLRAEAKHIVANWRVNFDADDDRPLVNMIETHLRAKAAAADRVREALCAYPDNDLLLIRRALDGPVS